MVELSTLTLADKSRFEAILSKAGHIALDCPLSGTGAQAKNRDLIVYASGDSAAIAQCSDLFADFAKQSADLGAFGNGSKMKFVANHLVAIHNVATAEAMVLAERAGLDPKMVVDLVGPGAGGSRMFQMRAPMMVERVYEPATMKVSTWKKDMAIIAEFADDVGCATPMFTLTQPVYTDAMAMGLGDQDTAAVFEVLKKTIITEPKAAASRNRRALPNSSRVNAMIDRKNRYGRTAARIHDADGLARRPSSPTIDIHAHIVIPQAAKLAQPHIDISTKSAGSLFQRRQPRGQCAAREATFAK